MKHCFFILFSLMISLHGYSQNCVGTPGQVKWSYWTGYTSMPDSNALFAREFFPETPNGQQTIISLSSPPNFSDNYGALTRGYIRPAVSGTYTFNVTGDDRVYFYLSPNQSPASKVKRAWTNQNTGQTEHTKYPEQTSAPVHLNAGQYYYFELMHFEGGGSDYASVFWKTTNQPNWQIIDYNSIYEYSCTVNCPPRGTPCNDNDPNTANDQQDGFCNCVGTYSSANNCVGEKGVLKAYYYDDIIGSYVEHDLTGAPKFPLLPDRMEKLKGLHGPLEPSTRDNYGSLVQGYLTVPVTGNYEFNLTGDNQTFFFMSKNDSPEFKQNHQMFVFYGVAEYEHNNSVLQNSGPLYLEKGKFYYLEFRHKDNNWRDHFRLFWKTPFHSHKVWKEIPSFYVYEFLCEVACIAQNTPCDDGNAFTNNDRIDANCNCKGTPCSGPDCDDAGARYQLYDDCSPTDNLNPSEEASWQSCSSAANPNPARNAANHWIKYSFDDIYKFNSSRIWNYNVNNETDKGLRQVVIDYSMDGINWSSLGGVYNWPQAPGLADYSGFVGPNFNDVKAKYILFSALNNHGDPSCSGFSKVTFNALLCNPKDTPCDDGDPLTFYDKFDSNCNCTGVDINCGTDSLVLGNQTLTDSLFASKKYLQSTSKIAQFENIGFTSGNSIVLLPGFETGTSTVFTAEIKNCIQEQFANNDTTVPKPNILNLEEEKPNLKKVIFRLNKPGNVKLELQLSTGETVVTLLEGFQENLGTQIKLIPTQRLQKGTYRVYLKINDNEMFETFKI